MVRFYPEVDITHEEAERLLRAPPNTDELQDPFNDVNFLLIGATRALFKFVCNLLCIVYFQNKDIATASPLSLDRPALRAMDPNHIIIIKSRRNPHNNYIFYRNILPDLQITYCPYCLLVITLQSIKKSLASMKTCHIKGVLFCFCLVDILC